MTSDELYSFLSDPKLLELIEINKTADNVFDVVNLNENQNSSVLAWCMNPNEGHAQGDAVIKDFLEAAFEASENCRFDNKKFFEKWTLGRIRTTSFGAAFVTREFKIKINDGSSNGRLDLFLVDPRNKILIAIENKVKATLDGGQLERYVKSVKNELATRKVFSDFDLAFVVIDKDLESYSETHLSSLGNRWCLLDYQWLEPSANRARHSLNRGNQSAQLLATYCQSVTNWESPASKAQSDLMADIALSYPAVIESMRELKRIPMEAWEPSTLQGPLGELMIFISQHRPVCEKLVNIRGITSLVQKLAKAIPSSAVDFIEEGSYWVALTSAQIGVFQRNEGWPIYLDIYRVARTSTPSAPKFTIKLVWLKNEFNPLSCSETELRASFEGAFNGLNKRQTSDRRRILIAEHITPTEAIDIATQSVTKISELLNRHLISKQNSTINSTNN
ncbi:PD-(D/E)XK nuclease family protein [Pseudomonas sp. NBRC 111139]|uniref:PDDEXK-like family protein n=1 Tax=Pseudomonas sp. NBRC 111139 TaxID=1661054 RepID=UPI0009F290CA|nr:PD-(D/E)XK nuclease family protein [Pseudomonas sp. NBRC 111139]